MGKKLIIVMVCLAFFVGTLHISSSYNFFEVADDVLAPVTTITGTIARIVLKPLGILQDKTLIEELPDTNDIYLWRLYFDKKAFAWSPNKDTEDYIDIILLNGFDFKLGQKDYSLVYAHTKYNVELHEILNAPRFVIGGVGANHTKPSENDVIVLSVTDYLLEVRGLDLTYAEWCEYMTQY